MASKKSYWWLKDRDTNDPAEWIPIVDVVPGELKFIVATGMRVLFDCPGKNGGECVVKYPFIYCYPNENLLAEVFPEDDVSQTRAYDETAPRED